MSQPLGPADVRSLLGHLLTKGLRPSAIAPSAFFARKTLREAATSWYLDTDGFPSLLGARVDPLAHQLYAALRVLRDREQRFLLADEVGLGKTIEAGLVLQALWHDAPDLRVLVVAPGSMAEQWRRELYLRFGARPFSVISAVQLGEAERTRCIASRHLIVTIGALSRDERLREQVAERPWDALVIDEAHHIDASHQLYPWLHGLAKAAKHVLVLSATPSRRELKGLAALLSLVSPGEYAPGDDARFEELASKRQGIWVAIDQARQLLDAAGDELRSEGAVDVGIVIDGWPVELLGEPRMAAWLQAARQERKPKAALELMRRAVVWARERWCIDHRIIRTRRRTLRQMDQKFSTRILEAELQYEASPYELEVARTLKGMAVPQTQDQRVFAAMLNQLAASTPDMLARFVQKRIDALGQLPSTDDGTLALAWNSDLGPEEEAILLEEAPRRCSRMPATVDGENERDWLVRLQRAAKAWANSDGDAPRRHQEAIAWIKERAAHDAGRRFLVFAQSAEVVEAFAEALRDQMDEDDQVATFHQKKSEQDLDRAALEFTRPDGSARVLVSDALGAEGRNFQVAWAIVHLDLPFSPARVEQRIGRVDRLGRPAGEPVRSVVVLGPMPAEEVFHKAYREVFHVYQESIGGLEFVIPGLVRRLREAAAPGAKTDVILSSVAKEVEAARASADEAFQAVHDVARPALNAARELADSLAVDRKPEQAIKPSYWLRELGANVSTNGQGGCTITFPPSRVEDEARHLSVPAFTGTWLRGVALQDETRQFLGPGHRIIDGFCALLDTAPHGRAALFRRWLRPANKGVLFAMLVFVTELPDTDEFPAGLIARARAVIGRDVNLLVLRFDAQQRRWEIERKQPEIERFQRPFERARGSGDADAADHAPELLSKLDIPALEQAVRDAQAEIQDRELKNGRRFADELVEAWADDFAYFDAVMESAEPAESERAGHERQLREKMLDKVRALTPRLDALALVVGEG
ncbi:SNF2-related protein [Sorangium sp. So ce1153]|uniref:SNF2-related protein n=1 Tax=Sorangium sp. So ce1153 TaxID=3133333 RepID=UPI003F61CFE8